MGVYRLFVPKQAVGASKIYFDLWNPTGSTLTLEIMAVVPVVSGAVAVTGVVGVDLFLQRTSEIGTGGTAATREGTSQTACTITRFAGNQNISDKITARLTPTGGATAGAVVGWDCVFSEETNAGTYTKVPDLVRGGYQDVPTLMVPENTGISVVQGSVASVGNIGFNVTFKVRPNTP